MSGKFEWHTLDEDSWDELPPLESVTPASNSRQWTSHLRSKKLIAILATLFLIILLGSRQILLRAQETNTQIKADVLTAHNFMLHASLDKDYERLDLALSESDMQWRHLQRVFMRRSLLFDRGPLNLWLDQQVLQQQLAGNTLSSELVLSPDLMTAELTTTLPYLTQNQDGTINLVMLNHFSHFAFDGLQWRQVPPTTGYWGPTERYNGQMITVEFPARDAEISRYFATALDEFFLALCRLESAIECASIPYIHITFTVDSKAFLPLSRPVQGNRFWIFGDRMAAGDTFEIALPTPSLIGLPESLQDRQLLLNGYANWLLTSYLTRKHPDLTFEHINQLMEELNLQLPPPVGYKPALTGADPALPAAQALLSCYDGDRITGQHTYDFTHNEWVSLDTDSCPNCGQNKEPGTNPSSPDGRFTFSSAADSNQYLLSRIDGILIEEISSAAHPVWLDVSNFAFISTGDEALGNLAIPDPAAEEGILIAGLIESQDKIQVKIEQQISQQALLSTLPDYRNIPFLRLNALLAPESTPDHLLILAGNGFHEQFLFRIHLESGEAVLITNWVDNGSIFRSMDMTENGRFLTVLRHNTWRSYLTLIDLDTGQRDIMDLAGRPLSRFAWSADEQWLLVTDDRLLRLISPTRDINLTFKHTHQDCTALTWAD